MKSQKMVNRGSLFSLVTVLMMLFALHGTTYAQSAVSIMPAEIESPMVGEQFDISINITGGANVAGYDLVLTYDSSALSLVNIANADYFTGNPFVIGPTPAAAEAQGQVQLIVTSFGGGSDGDGTLATATFEVVEVKDSSIGFDSVTVANASAMPIEITIAGSAVTGAAAPPADDGTTDDGTTDDGMTDDGTTDDGTTDDGTTDDGTTDDGTTDDGMVDDGTTDDGTTDDGMVDDGTTDDGTTDDGMTDDGTMDDGTTDDGTTDDGTTDDTSDQKPMASFSMMLDSGLNMISLPLDPEDAFTAQSFADAVDATVVIKLDAASQKFVGFTAGEGGDGFAIEGGMGYIVNTPDGGSVTFTGTAWDNQSAATAPGINPFRDAWAFAISGNLQNADPHTNYTLVAKNLRTGAVATEPISSSKIHSTAVWANLNRNSVIEAGDRLEITVVDDRGNIVSGPFAHTVDIADIRQAYLRLSLVVGDVHPEQTRLAQNFPNPFNPETWMPFQLSESSFASIQIYNASGQLVRTLDLGMKPAGFYMTRSTAPYWDGRNDTGEHVASGVYFYTLKTDSFAATRKMLISK